MIQGKGNKAVGGRSGPHGDGAGSPTRMRNATHGMVESSVESRNIPRAMTGRHAVSPAQEGEQNYGDNCRAASLLSHARKVLDAPIFFMANESCKRTEEQFRFQRASHFKKRFSGAAQHPRRSTTHGGVGSTKGRMTQWTGESCGTHWLSDRTNQRSIE